MDARTLIEAAFAVAAFFAAFWIKGVRDEMRELIKRVNDHGERIAVLESRGERIAVLEAQIKEFR